MNMASRRRRLHQRRIDLIGLEQIVAARGIGVVHGNPGIGDDAVGARHGLLGRRGDGNVGAIGAAPRSAGRRSARVRWAGDAQLAAQPAHRMNPGGGDIVAVAHPGHGLVRERPHMLFQRHDIGHDLAGMGSDW